MKSLLERGKQNITQGREGCIAWKVPASVFLLLGALRRHWPFKAKQRPSFELSWVIATSVPTEFHALPIEKAQISSP